MAKMKTGDNKPAAVDWQKLIDVGLDTGSKHAVTVVNFLLQQLVTRTAAKLDVGESCVRLDFGRRRNDNSFAWTATLYASSSRGAFKDRREGDTPQRVVLHEGVAEDPMEAVAALVDEVECSD